MDRRVQGARAWLLVLAAVVAAAVGVVASSAHVSRRVELASVDARFSVRGAQKPPRDVVVVGIDAKTRSAHDLPRPPLPRADDARVVDTLRRDGARVIALDLDFNEPTDSRDDTALTDAVTRAGNVVVGTAILRPGAALVFGSPRGAQVTHALAGSVIVDTRFGVVRRVQATRLGTPWFSVAAAERYEGHAIGSPALDGDGAWIDFAGPPGTVTTRSYVDVLRNRVPASAFRSKVVIVGDTDPLLKDIDNTPTGEMAGPELQANAIATILAGFPLRDPAGWLALILICGLGAVVPLSALRLAGLRWLPVPLIAGAAYLVIAQLAFNGGTVLPVAAPMLALIVGSLSTLAIAYSTDVRDRRRLRAAFARFVPPQVVDEVVAQSGGVRLGGTLREGTVVFCDLRGFTTLTEQTGAAHVIELLNRYLTEMSDAMLEHGGTVVSYMGDGIMAVFGAPLPQDDHADRALAAAREMLDVRLPRFNAWLAETAAVAEPLRMGIGICTGPVMSGNVGSPRRLEYTAVGDTTNTASRLQTMTKDVGVSLLVSDATRVALREGPSGLRQVGTLDVRGRSAPIVAWTLDNDDGAGPKADPAVDRDADEVRD